jgi:hypothetical protein
MASDELAEVKSTRQRPLDCFLEKIRIVVEEITAAAEGGIAHKDVESPRVGESGRDEGLTAFAGKNVGFDRPALPPEGTDFLHRRVQVGTAGAVIENEVGPGFREGEGTTFADAASGTGDESDFTGEFHGN